ncbi:MAG: hypothetical protein KBC73_25900 [Burkholderiaceae bacterium]|nr:hypothetical protein [Burkholderiaceae bacterium]
MSVEPVPDVARVRFDNAMRLFDEFVQATVRSPDAATLRGLERRFAERLQIQPSYWSQIKARSRQIGERLARQFEQQCRKPAGWMDQVHDVTPGATARAGAAAGSAVLAPGPAAGVDAAASPSQPQDDDERFIVGLVLSYYRRHPQRARTRLLDLLGEVLGTPDTGGAPAMPAATAATPAPSKRPAPAAQPQPAQVDEHALWLASQTGVAPLKRSR